MGSYDNPFLQNNRANFNQHVVSGNGNSKLINIFKLSDNIEIFVWRLYSREEIFGHMYL